MRVNGDEMGWQWMEQFLYWAKANSQSGSASAGGADEAGASPPLRPSSPPGKSDTASGKGGGIGEERGARGKDVGTSFGGTGGGIEETEEEKQMR